MTGFNGMWLLIGLLVGTAAGMASIVGLVALGAAGRGRRQRRRITRTCVAAWRALLPGWRPDADQLECLMFDAEPPEVISAYRAIADGWADDDARWDVLLAVLIHTRRESLRYRVDRIRAVAAAAPPVTLKR